MIHIATVHWRYDRWIDIQLRYLERNIDEPYRVYAWLDADMSDQASKFFYSTDVPIKQHEIKLTLLGDLVAHAAEPEEMIMFIDGDAFPIAPIVPFLREKLDRYPIVAVRRDENNGDPQGGGFRATAGGRLWRAAVEDKLHGSLRGRLAGRLPRRGRLGRLRKMISPVRRYREALAEELADVNERVFDLITRDDQFYLQLIDPERGGELTTIKAPVVLDDVKELSATR
jgi:hypothetical protein